MPRRTRARGRMRLALAAGALSVCPGRSEAQVAPEGGIRVLETVQPASGRRSLHVMEGLSPAEIRAVQEALRAAGFAAAWREGHLDPFTRGALQRFQTQRGLAVCACVSLGTLIELGLGVQVAETVVLEEPTEVPPAPAVQEGAESSSPLEPPVVVNYGSYYPYGVIFLAPFYHPRRERPSDPVRRGSVYADFPAAGLPTGVHSGAWGGRWPGAGPWPPPAPLGPFPRVSPPPNVVRGGG